MKEQINEHDVVCVGSRTGTVVHVYKTGFNYEVEFNDCVETVHIDDITPLSKEK